MTVQITQEQVFRALHTVLLVVIVGLLLWQQPWNTSGSSTARTITVSGEGTAEATPDEYVFTPYFQRTGTDKAALQKELNQLANDTIEGLKGMGVAEKDIKLDASSYDTWFYQEGEEGVLNVSLTISLTAGELVQKVQDYLLAQGAEGQVTPQASFGDEKRKELEAEATKLASEDARKKAEAQAAQFGLKLGDVVKVENSGSGFGGVFPVAMDSSAASAREISVSAGTLPVLPGENEITLTVNATYELQ